MTSQSEPFKVVTAPYVGTYPHVVQAMLRRAVVQPGEEVVDLGAGDGRVVLAAARDFGARAVGVEQDPSLAKAARESIEAEGLEDNARIIEGDMLTFDLRQTDVVTLFLNSHSNQLVAPKLQRELRPGARVVSYLFPLRGWLPVESVLDPPGHRLHIYHIPVSLPREESGTNEPM